MKTEAANDWRGLFTAFVAVVCALAMIPTGCGRFSLGGAAPYLSGPTQMTSSMVRAQRRAYDGAPPVVPHSRLGAACTACHTASGKEVPGQGFAPANPHLETDVAGRIANCTQCHVFAETSELFAENAFQGLRQDLRKGDRLYADAPPVIPHQTFMRENCSACHDGPAARPEIRCSHAERLNCVQCHVHRNLPAADDWPTNLTAFLSFRSHRGGSIPGQ